jgi:plastocyanin
VANATVTITDQGITPATASVVLGGSVTFLNWGLNVHAAAIQGTSTFQGFDTGGLATGRGATFTMSQAGTFSYTSPPDCLFGNKNPQFNCGPYKIVVVDGNAAQATPAPTALPALAAPNPNTTVAIDDQNGFTPRSLTIKAGQGVTWSNRGTLVHSVSSDPGYSPSFESGGLGAGATFTFNFFQPGTYTYHSQPDTVYVNNPACGCPAATYPAFTGVINVTP